MPALGDWIELRAVFIWETPEDDMQVSPKLERSANPFLYHPHKE